MCVEDEFDIGSFMCQCPVARSCRKMNRKKMVSVPRDAGDDFSFIISDFKTKLFKVYILFTKKRLLPSSLFWYFRFLSNVSLPS